MTLLRVAFQTLGCKLNQLETESIADAFLDSGAKIVSFHETADLYVVNTCTVTSKAEQKARHDIRAALVRAPECIVVATGCYAQMDPEQLAMLSERVLVVPGDLKASLLSLARWLAENWQGHGALLYAAQTWQRETAESLKSLRSTDPSASFDRFAFHPDHFAMHSRPALKIQDGCNHRCAYCRVCFARGPSISLSAREVLQRVQRLELSGKNEVVLTGVNLAQYQDGTLDFSSLLALLIRETNSIRFRISSYEPERIDDAFITSFSNPRVRPHMHLSVQSGCDETLKRMARPYRAVAVQRAVNSLREVREDPFLACDMIAGFPGETDAEFETTFSFLSELDFAWIHAFPFSARPGTRAANMTPRVPERIAGERVDRLLDLARTGKQAYIARWFGREVEMVMEHSSGNSRRNQDHVPTEISEPVLIIGTTENYLKAEARLGTKMYANSEAFAPGNAFSVILTQEQPSSAADISAIFPQDP